MSTPDRYDELAKTVGAAAGLKPEQIPGLAHVLRELAREERERCAKVADDCNLQDEIDYGNAATGAAGNAAARIRALE